MKSKSYYLKVLNEFKSELSTKIEDFKNNNENYETKTLSQLNKLLSFRIRKKSN